MARKTRNHNKSKGAASDISRRIGANMRFFRRRAAIPQKEVAKMLGISYQQLQKYETGVNRISAEYIYMLKNFYNVPYEDFFRDVDPPEFPDTPDDDPVARAIFWKIASIEDRDLKRRIRKVINLLVP